MTITIALEIACFICAVIFLRKESNMIWRANIFFLLIVIIFEEAGLYFAKAKLTALNHLVYQVMTVPEVIFMSAMFYQVLKEYFKPLKLVVPALLLIFSVYIFGIFKAPNSAPYLDTTFTLMSVVFSFYGFLYIFLIIKSDEYVELEKHAPFWWVTGALIYYFGGLATDIFFNVFELKGLSNELNSYISMVLSAFMYLLLGYSFRCRYQQKNSSFL